ncbi:hypothetical protein [Micromonospora sp. NBC_01813]|uniref:hypothetical protein n=1 Tax=Micromonospora sp. NBC_01813 TaxID=2975988 RepID=UPI002DD81323|nr:hypothetical protein [Micromonospora sp. NBC_01813]WSA11793.1 hypothetical protein OG958_13960 [Micromonospora sp. NBC_01813]
MDPNRNHSDDSDPRWYSERTYVDKPWQSSSAERYPRADPQDGGAEPATDRFGDDPLGLAGRYAESGRRAAAEPTSTPPFAAPGSSSRPPFAPPGPPPRPPFAPPGAVSAPPSHGSESVSGPPSADLEQRIPSVERPPEWGVSAESARTADPGRSADRRSSIDVPTGPMPPVTPAAPRPAGDGPPAGEYGRRSPSVGPIGDGVYRSSRPALTILYAALVMIFEVPALRVLLDGALADPVQVGAVVAGTALMIGLPLLALGMLGLSTGATKVGDPVEAWLRPPTAYLLVGLVLFVVAGLAAS